MDHPPPPPPSRHGRVHRAKGEDALLRLTGIMIEVSADLAFARRKMDVAVIERLIDHADAIAHAAWVALRHADSSAALRCAEAVDHVLRAARDLMLSELGDRLPSAHARQPRPGLPEVEDLLRSAQQRTEAVGLAVPAVSGIASALVDASREVLGRAIGLRDARQASQAAMVALAINPLLDAVEVLCRS